MPDICIPNLSSKLDFIWSLSSVSGLVATFNETRAPTSRRYVTEQGMLMPDVLRTFQFFRSHYSVLAVEKYPKTLNFHSSFGSQKLLMAIFSETCVPTSG